MSADLPVLVCMPVESGPAPVLSERSRCATCHREVWVSVRGRGSVYRLACVPCVLDEIALQGHAEIEPAPWVLADLE